MSKIALTGNASGTGTLTIASPNTNVDRTLTLPDNTGTLLSTTSTSVLPKGAPLFIVTGSAAQSLVTTTQTKINTPVVVADTASCYNTGLSRYIPNVAGYYQIVMDLQYTGATFTGGYFVTYLNKNGTTAEVYVAYNPGAFIHSSVSRIVYLNGTTDYVEMWGRQDQGTAQTVTCLAFQGVLVRAD